MNEELRRVRIRADDEETFFYADFIMWGTREEYSEDRGRFPITVAVVEKDNGRVLMIEPDRIRFVQSRVVHTDLGNGRGRTTTTWEPERDPHDN